MSAALETRAEVAKLARLLHAEPERLAFLEAAAPEELRRYREEATDLLFDGDRERLQRAADASRLLPVKVLATIGQRAFGPLLCARLTGLLEPSRGAEIGERLPAQFLAEVAGEMDPRRATEVITRIPPERSAQVAGEMARRGEHVAMGRFVAHLSDEALAACLEEVGDEDVLRVAFVLEGKRRLDAIARLMDDERVARVAETAAARGLWPELLDLASHLGKRQARRVARIAFAQWSDEDLAALAAAAGRDGLLELLRPLLDHLDDEQRGRVAEAVPGLA